MNKKEIYQRLDNLENKISKLENKITNLENDLIKERLSRNTIEEKLSRNTYNQSHVVLRSFEHPSGVEQYENNSDNNLFKFTVSYIKAINFLNCFKYSFIGSIKLRDEMLNKKVVDLKRCEIEDLAPKEKSIVGYSIYTSQETQVAKVLNQPFDFDPITIIRVAKYIQEVQDLDYKVSKYAEFEDYEEE